MMLRITCVGRFVCRVKSSHCPDVCHKHPCGGRNMTYDTMYGRVELTNDGLYEAAGESDRRYPLAHGRVGSLYLSAANAVQRDDAAMSFVKVLNKGLTKVYVVTDNMQKYADLLPAEQILDVRSCADKISQLSTEMEERYIDLLNADCVHAEDYNNRNYIKMQLIFVILDALDSYAEGLGAAMYPLVRISQKGRAAGINVVACAVDDSPTDFAQVLKSNCSACFVRDNVAEN